MTTEHAFQPIRWAKRDDRPVVKVYGKTPAALEAAIRALRRKVENSGIGAILRMRKLHPAPRGRRRAKRRLAAAKSRKENFKCR